MNLGRKTTEVNCHSHHIIPKVHAFNMTISDDASLYFLREVVFASLGFWFLSFHVKHTFLLFFHDVLFSRKLLYAFHTQEVGLYPLLP